MCYHALIVPLVCLPLPPSQYVATLVSDFRDTLLPLVFAPLQRNATAHWNATVHTLSQNVLKLFHDMDAPLFDQTAQKFEAAENARKEAARARRDQWAKLPTKSA